MQPSKPLDANRYATKKTIAQGMLDIALLTANASQLKYILQVGPRHEFYSLMLGLISTSMILQVSPVGPSAAIGHRCRWLPGCRVGYRCSVLASPRPGLGPGSDRIERCRGSIPRCPHPC